MATTFARAQPRTVPNESDRGYRPMSKGEKKPPRSAGPETPRYPRPDLPLVKGPQCFDCGGWGHIARLCPRRKTPEEPMEIGYVPKAVLYSAEMGSAFRVSVRVNGCAIMALLVSGCRQSVIQDVHVHPTKYTQEIVNIRCVHGDVKAYPVAEVPLVPQNGPSCQIRVGGPGFPTRGPHYWYRQPRVSRDVHVFSSNEHYTP